MIIHNPSDSFFFYTAALHKFLTYPFRGLAQMCKRDKAVPAWLCKRTPAARWGDPQELIGAAVFLSSKASDFVNGHLLFVDGGMLVAV